ncbi:MAG: gliding motility-associated C-terminal domain-containing protein, partial [Bacteroidales bacterium]|nr:gliding motility-associated C-terminal domain-containing protein [Bacteroidales bacterium]
LGGSLGDGADWYWYSDAAFTTLVGSGGSVVVNPIVNTTYYVRAQGDCNTTAAVSQLVTVRVPSTDPASISILNDNTCQGTSKTLTVLGGSLGDGADWYWYSDATFVTLVGTGASIAVDPAVNTTYYVRAEGDCNNTNAVSQLVTVRVPSTDPTGIFVANDNTCEGTSKTLTVQGGSLGDGADWQWYSDAAFTVSEGNGVSISVDPPVNTTYYVRAEGDCNITTAASQVVTVKVPSVAPTGITVANDNTCEGNVKTLTVTGGSLGDGAIWNWSTDAGFSTSAGTGASIGVDPAVTMTYYVRAEGDCNITTAAGQVVTVRAPSVAPTGITITDDNTCQGTSKTLTVTGGSLGDGADWYWSTDAAFSTTVGTGVSISVDPAVSTTYYVRAEGDCNTTSSVNQLVTVRVPSTDPSGITITNDNTCVGTSKDLTVAGGSLGDGADWYWYSDAAFTVSEGTGLSISVDPAVSTTYYVRAEGDCNNTNAVNQLVTVRLPSTDPTGISITNDNTCEGTNKTLTVTGGSLGDGADWQWYSDAAFTVAEGNGVSISVDPAVNTTYYVRAEGDCNTTNAVSQLVTVKVPSTDPTGITITGDDTCEGMSKTLTVTGGSLGDGADWQWYSDAGFTVSEGNGVSITVDPAVSTTYYVRAEGDCNNTNAVSQLVTVRVSSTDPTGISVADDNTCEGTSKTLTVTGGSLGDGADWYWYSDAALTVAEGTGITISVDPVVSTTYYVRAEGDCNNTAAVSQLVTVRAPSTDPTGITITDDNTCEGTNKTLTVTGGSLGDGADWQWYSDAAFTISEGNGVSISVDPAVNTTYYVRAEGDCNTTNAVSQLVTVRVPSTDPSGITITNDNTCVGNSKDLTVAGGSLGDGADWYWYSDAALTVAEGTGVSISVDPAVSTTYYVRAEGDCNNTNAVNQLVTVRLPSTDPTGISITNDNTCQGTNKTLTVTGGSLGDGADWYWYSDAALTVAEGTGVSISVDPAVDTTYYVRAEGDCNTTAVVSSLVTVKTGSVAPTGIAVTNDSTCQGDVKTLTVTGGSLGDGADWQWYSDAAFAVAEGNGVTIWVDPDVSSTYYVRAEGDCNNTNAVSQLVTVLTPSLDPTGISVVNDNTCPGVEKILTVTGGSLGEGAIWNWSTDPAFGTSADTGVSITIDPAINTTYYVRAEGTCNTSISVEQLVTVKILSQAPSTATVDTDEFCFGAVDSITLSYSGGVLGTGAGAYWYTDSLFADTAIAEGNDVTVPAPSDTTTFFVRFEGECDTTDAVSVTVIVNPFPTPSINGIMIVCEPAQLEYTVTGFEGSTFSWNVSGGTIIGDASGMTVTVEWIDEGVGSVEVTENTTGGCIVSTDSSVVKYATPSAVAIEGGSAVVCSGDTGIAYYVAGLENSSFNWTVEEGVIVRDFGDSIIVDWTVAPDEYTITLQEISEYGCTGEMLSRVINVAGPEVELGEDTYVCEGDMFEITLDEGYSSYLWHDGSTGPEFSTGSEGWIGVVVEDTYGCSVADSMYLTIHSLPEVDLGNDTSLCGDMGLILDAGSDGNLYRWSTGDNSREITVFLGERQEIWVEVENEFGCTSMDTIIIGECNPEFYFRDIPTAITPNGDGTNDVWRIPKLDTYTQAEIEIFSRWGTLIWKSEPGYSVPWDGRDMRGNLVPMDSYHFVIKLNVGSVDRVTGIVTVIR